MGRWTVDFLFAEKKYDIDGVLGCLYDAGAPSAILDQAEDLMRNCNYDCGFTFSNAMNFRAVVCIGPTSSGKEFQNTLTHEIHHLAVAIARSLGIDLESETPAYLAGDTMREFADVVCRFGCEHCHP